MLGKEFTYIIVCPVCGKKEKISIYSEELANAPHGLKEVVIRHFEVYPHDIKLVVDRQGVIRGMYVHRVERGEVKKYRSKIARELYPILLRSDAMKKMKGIRRDILSLCDGFNSVDDIAGLLKVSVLTVLEILAEFKEEGIVDVINVFRIEPEGLEEAVLA